MRLLTILCLVLLSVHSYSQEVVTGPFLIIDGITYDQNTNEPVTGIVESFHGNGQLSSRGNFIYGKRDGLWEYFYENSQLLGRGNYIDGGREGLHETFHENGQLEIRGNYIDGEPDGLYELFYENGQLKRRGNYIDGKRTRTYRNGVPSRSL